MQKVYQEIKGLLGALAIAMIVRTFLFQPFVIPSGSMYPTMEIGDFLFVSKYSYGYSNYSFPFAPDLFKGRIFDEKPTRGQVVVFRNPIDETKSLFKKMTFRDDSLDFIKRLIGLPGDRIQIKQGILNINGEPVKLERVEDYTYQDPRDRSVKVMVQYIETLPNGVSYHIIKDRPFEQNPPEDSIEYVVPEGHYFFMGDNRDHSGDSRYLNMLGYVPEDHLIGPARLIFFSTSARWYDVTDYISGIRPSRIMKVIH